MAAGKLGSTNPAADTDTALYQVPAGKMATVTVSICETGGAPAKVRLAISENGDAAPTADDYLEYDAPVDPNGVLERSGIVVGNQQQLFVRADTANVAFVAFGIEGDE